MALGASIFQGASPLVAEPINLFLIQLLLVVILSKGLAFLFKFIKQPPVIAEVVAGILLGPSAFGKIPGFTDNIYPVASLTTFNVFANWGLILFMYMVGLEIDTKIMKKNVTSALAISVSAMICPFALGIASSWVIHNKVGNAGVSYTSFLLFVAVAMSITAFPVLARILTETKILHTRVGTVALAAAAVDDVVAWCLLALVVAYANAVKTIYALYTFLCLIGFILVMFLVVRPLLAAWARKRVASAKPHYTMVMFLFGGIFLASWITQIIGVHAIFGSFILGIITPRKNRFAHSILERLEDLVVIILLPLYFTFSGLRTNIGSLSAALDWGLVILVVSTACVGKFVGGLVAAKFVGCNWRESASVGVLMNTKGLVELIVLNVGLDVGVLNTKIFTMFVIMALVTTFMTTPIIYFLYVRNLPKDDELASTDTYSVLIATQTNNTLPSLILCSSLFAEMKQKFSLKAIFLTEISDRPSTLFFTEFYSTFQDAPLLGGKKKKGILSDMNSAAKNSGIQTSIQTKNLASSNLPVDVTTYINTHECSLALFNAHYSTYESKANKSFDVRQSISAVNNSVEKIFSFGPNDDLLKQAIKKGHPTIGIYIQKSEALAIEKVESVLFIYHGEAYEQAAVQVIQRTKENIKVSVLCRTSARLDISNPNVVVLDNSDFSTESKRGYDLIVIGANRDEGWIGYSSPEVTHSKTPTLLIYPPRETHSTDVDIVTPHVMVSGSLDGNNPVVLKEKRKYSFKEEELP